MKNIYPLSFLINPISNKPITFNPKYINQIKALNLLDYFTPTQFNTNPLFAKVDTFNYNIGILQTATNAIKKILTYIDAYKNLNTQTKDLLQTLADKINSVIQNTTFNNNPVFNQTITLGDKKINLTIPTFSPDTNIEKYEKLLLEKQKNIFEILQHIKTLTPFDTNNVNPINFENFHDLLNSGLLQQAYNTNLINLKNISLLLSD